jgi:hypothetical protein
MIKYYGNNKIHNDHNNIEYILKKYKYSKTITRYNMTLLS